MKKLNIVVSLITHDNDFQQEQAAVAEVTARKLALDLHILYANNDGVTQSLQLVSLIQNRENRPDAIVVEPVGTGMLQVAQAAVAADIGWAVLNRNVDYLARLRASSSVPMFAVSTDNTEVGRIQGEQFNVLLPKGGCVLYLEGPSTSDAARKRSDAMLARKRPDISIKTLRGDWTEASAYNALKSWLRLPTSRELHIGVVGCQNDAMALGARRAIQEFPDLAEREKLLKLPLTGCDGVPARGQAYVQRKNMTATVINPPLTGPALEMLADAFRSQRVPAEHTFTSPSSFPAIEKLRP